MPRMAWNDTGRPTMRSCRRPQTSVQGWSSTTGCSNATCAISAAKRRMRSAGTPQRSATASGAYSGAEVALRHQVEHRPRARARPAT